MYENLKLFLQKPIRIEKYCQLGQTPGGGGSGAELLFTGGVKEELPCPEFEFKEKGEKIGGGNMYEGLGGG